MERDYKNFDYLSVTVKKDALSYLAPFYLALGWQIIGREEHRRYSNELNLTFRRPHRIENKDDLQLLQIYIETSVNQLGKYAVTRHPRTTVFGALSGVLCLSLTVVGLVLALAFGYPQTDSASFIWGITAASLGVILLAVFMSVTAVIYRREEGYGKERVERLKKEITEAITAAGPLLNGGEVGNAAAYAALNGFGGSDR